jgi:hypothetical protein
MKLGALAPLAAVALVACAQQRTGSTPIPPPDAGIPSAPLPTSVTPADVARRLSLFLWNVAPDDELTKAVYAQPLATTDDVRRLAAEMLTDPRGRDGVREFFHQWMHLDRLASAKKDPAAYPEWTPALRDAMIEGAESFALYVTFDGDSRFRTLLTADFALVNETTAPLYGLNDVAGSELRKVTLPSQQRAGVFTLAAVLAAAPDSSKPAISSRGVFVLSLLGQPPPPEPPSLRPGLPNAPLPDPSQTMRAQLEMTVGASPQCAGCHQFMDPAGLAFGHFDTLGRYQETDNGMPIDASATWNLPGDYQRSFDGARQLVDLLADSPQLADALVVQLFSFAGTRQEPQGLLDVRVAFERRGFDLRELILDVAAMSALAP